MDRYRVQRFGFALLGLVTVIVVAPILLVIGAIAIRGFEAIDWGFLTSMPRDGMRAGGIFPAIVGTLWLTLGTALILYFEFSHQPRQLLFILVLYTVLTLGSLLFSRLTRLPAPRHPR